jgi:hypothetical protein
MDDSEPKRPGRPPAFNPQRKGAYDIHLYLGADIWTALKDYSEETGELSLSVTVRRIVKARLIELGYVKQKVRLLPQSNKSP